MASTSTQADTRQSGATAALVLLTGLNLFNYIDRYVLPPVQPMIEKEFHLSGAEVGSLSTAFFFVYMLAAPLTGWLGDRYPRKPVLIAGALFWSAMTLLTATVHSYSALFFRHAIVGIGEATFVVLAPSILSDLYSERARNKVLTIFNIALPVGAALGYLAGGALGSRYGWRAPFYVAAAPGAVIAVVLMFMLREPKRGASDLTTAGEGHRENPKLSLRAVIKLLRDNRAYQTATLGMAWLTFSIGGISIWMPTFLERHAGYSPSTAGFALGAVTAVDGILGTFAGGWVAQRMLRTDHRALYRLSAWSMLFAVPFAVLAFFGPRVLVMPAIAVAEFCLFLNTGPLNAAIVNSVGAYIRSTALALEVFLIHLLGDVPSGGLIGWVSDHTNLRIGLGITLPFMVGSGLILLAGMRYAPKLEQPPDAAAVQHS